MCRTAGFSVSGRSSRRWRALVAAIPALFLVAAAWSPPALADTPVTDPAPPVTATDPPVTDPAPPVTDPAPPVTDPAPPVTDPDPPVTDPGPPATSGPSATAIPSWGTAKNDSKGRAQLVNTVVEAGGVAYLGGYFTKMVAPGGDDSESRGRLAAINGNTGKLTSWDPDADGTVWAMELSADRKSVYVGGDFNRIGGRSASKLARIDLSSGKLDTSFRPAVKGRVRGLALDGGRLYLGGEFTSVGGKSRPKLAAVDAATGNVLSWTPPPLGRGRYIGQTGVPTKDYNPGHVFAVEVMGGRVFAAGSFLDLGGEGGLVTLDAATGALAGPQHDPGKPMFDLDTSGNVLYAVGGGPGGRLYAYSATKAKPLWSAKFDGDAVGVAVSRGAVYVAGHYDYIVSKSSSCYQLCPGGPRRRHLSAFSTEGKLLAWNPEADTSTGPYAVVGGAGAVYVGGEFNKVNGKAQPGFAIFPR
jgi:hypothetical protein